MNILGIDIGGTSIKAALVNTETGTISGRSVRLATPAPCTREALLATLAGIVKDFAHSGPVGLGFPGVILSGVVATAANMHPELVGMRLGDELRARTGCASVSVVNDADAAGLAIATLGDREVTQGLTIVLTLGTGIGGALIHGGRLIPNFEPARYRVRNPLGQPGDEIEAEYLLSEINRQKLNLTWEQWSSWFGDYLAEIHATLRPEKIILGGGGAYQSAHFMPLLKTPCPVSITHLGNEAGILGAALAAR